MHASPEGRNRGRVIGILGPTGGGKTAVAVEVARALSIRVISCDSMQLYRGFPVLTNAPTPTECAAAPHELVGCLDPGHPVSAVEYARMARPLIEEDLAEKGWALIAGGTGLYMRAALAPLDAPAEGSPELRERLEALAISEGPRALHLRLEALDATAASRIDARNVRRVARALESVILTGRRWSERDDLWSPVYHFPTLIVGLNLDRGELYSRIDARAEAIVRQGAVDEVQRYRVERGTDLVKPGAAGIESAIGFREIMGFLEGRHTLGEIVLDVAAATRRYARRQLTWLRKLEDAVIIQVQDRGPEQVADEILTLAQSVDDSGNR